MEAKIYMTGEIIPRGKTLNIAEFFEAHREDGPKHAPDHAEAGIVRPYIQHLTIDVGCGATKCHPSVIGIDRLGPGEKGKHGCMIDRESVADIQAEGDDLYFIEDNFLDSVISLHCLEHFHDPEKALQEWARVLRPKGIMALVLPNDDWKDFLNMDGSHAFRCYPWLIEKFIQKIPDLDLLVCGEVVIPDWSFRVVAQKI